MNDDGQFLERFRSLSRDMQNGIQNLQKCLRKPLQELNEKEFASANATLDEINDVWGDFVGWVLIGTLDDLDDARKNCAPGRVDIQSKLIREKKKKHSLLLTKGVKLDITNTHSLVIETYIQYFEQLIDLVLSNSIKYSAKAGSVEVVSSKSSSGVKLQIDSIGPLVTKAEVGRLGEKGFRSDAAKKLHVQGQGVGLFNAKRLAKLLGATIDFRPGAKVLFDSSGVPFASFSVLINFPDSPV